jgi:hypothetical protein
MGTLVRLYEVALLCMLVAHVLLVVPAIFNWVMGRLGRTGLSRAQARTSSAPACWLARAAAYGDQPCCSLLTAAAKAVSRSVAPDERTDAVRSSNSTVGMLTKRAVATGRLHFQAPYAP